MKTMKRCLNCGIEAEWNTYDCPICLGPLESLCPSDGASCSLPSSSGIFDAPRINYCLWEWDIQRQCNDTECGKYVLRFEAEAPMKYCPFCGGVITAM